MARHWHVIERDPLGMVDWEEYVGYDFQFARSLFLGLADALIAESADSPDYRDHVAGDGMQLQQDRILRMVKDNQEYGRTAGLQLVAAGVARVMVAICDLDSCQADDEPEEQGHLAPKMGYGSTQV